MPIDKIPNIDNGDWDVTPYVPVTKKYRLYFNTPQWQYHDVVAQSYNVGTGDLLIFYNNGITAVFNLKNVSHFVVMND